MFHRRIAFPTALALAALISACSGEAKHDLVGTWAVDLEATAAADPKSREMSEADRAKLLDFGRELHGGMLYTFTADARIEVSKDGAQVSRFTYAVPRADGDSVTIEITTGEGDGASTDTITARVDGDRLVMKGSPDIVLERR